MKSRFQKQTKTSPSHSDSHPLFTPVSVTSHTSLFETDYNLHKSNSTYFSDLDISRTALVTNLCTPGMEICRRELDQQVDASGRKKYPGRLSVMLGSVYCSFKKEIPPYERYEMQSRLSGWDEKWLYVVTYFLRPEKRRGQGKTILAIGVSQYVIKKGRLTIKPTRVLQASGLVPDKPQGSSASSTSVEGGATPDVGVNTPESGEAISAGEGLDESLVREVMTLADSGELSQAVLEDKKRENGGLWDGEEWTWERIEQGRLEGLEAVKAFVGLDAKLNQVVDL
ncbi:hypothetical protein FQN51_007080 [Onygenales sp. PD_10]|nr:hypothetical protein FQN51_007080 [Onygenales sp. PD_10]